MLIDLRELFSGTRDELKVTADIGMDCFKTSTAAYDITNKNPIELLIKKSGKNEVRITGSTNLTLSVPCDRCLESVPVKLDISIERDAVLGEKTFDTKEDHEEKDYIDGYNLDVDRLVFGEILIEMPAKILCSDDCKGLCPVCGKNLNLGECGCDRESLDPRMSVFKDILNNFKEV